MLNVCSRAAEQHRPGRIFHIFAVHGHKLAVAFHIQLLQIHRHILQILVIGNNRITVQPEEIVVPDAEHAENNRNVMFKIGIVKMLIHRIGAFKHPFKILKSNRDGNNQADGRPHGIASADKIPEFKHVFGINAELLHLFCIRRQRHKMLGNRMFTQGVNQPFAAGSGIGKRFNGRKGLGRNDKQRRLGINLVQNLGTGRSVNIGNEIAVDILGPVFAQSLAGHNRPQVRTADAYIDDIGQLFAGLPLKLAETHRVGKFLHLRQNFVNLRHDVFAVNVNRRIGTVSQCNMQNGAAFGYVDFIAFEHRLDFIFQIALSGQIQQQFHCPVVNAVFGIIHIHCFQINAEFLCPIRITGKQIFHFHLAKMLIVTFQLFPGFCFIYGFLKHH